MAKKTNSAPILVSPSDTPSSSSSPSGHDDAQPVARGREVAGIALLSAALFVGLSLITFQLGRSSLMGPGGHFVANAGYALVGVGSYLIVWVLARLSLAYLAGRAVAWWSAATGAVFGALASLAVLLHLAVGSYRVASHGPGGLVGEMGAELLAAGVGRIGAILITLTLLSISIVLATSKSVVEGLRSAWDGIKRAVAALGRGVVMLFPERSEPPIGENVAEDTVADVVNQVDDIDVASARSESSSKKASAKKDREKEKAVREPSLRLVAKNGALIKDGGDDGVPIAMNDAGKTEANAEPTEHDLLPSIAPMIIEPVKAAPEKKQKPAGVADFVPALGGYKLPDIALLDEPEVQATDLNKQEMLELADRLQKSLADFGVKGQVVQIHPGPVVTMYEFVPSAGTKLSKITTLSNDLAMSLHALRVRIVAPIPGKGSVGIEVPNKVRATVFIKDIMTDDSTQKQRSRLQMALGKDIAGAPVAVDLAKMPHLLVAGTTGSGKSVAVNGMICSILLNATPDEVRMIMIDPKMVELSIYEGIPHLLLPVVTDPKKANLALKWAVDEMERRYELVSKAGVRDIISYNKTVEKQLAAEPVKIEPKPITVYIDGQPHLCDPNEAAVKRLGGVVTEDVRDEISAAHSEMQKRAEAIAAEPLPKKLPYIVVLIDEFADLMMVAPKDIETSVARIAQKARAVGIHLIVATQRPSVDVITGLIKANFPSRIAFQVASKIDSRTILDQQGAENLLGMGDMLFTDRGQALRRIHGALVTDTEINRLVSFLKTQGSPVYDLDILKPREGEDEDGEMGGGDAEMGGSSDPLYDQAVRIVCETRSASVSMLQRRLQIGFNRSARLIEKMEKDGIVGAPNGSKPREVIANAI